MKIVTTESCTMTDIFTVHLIDVVSLVEYRVLAWTEMQSEWKIVLLQEF